MPQQDREPGAGGARGELRPGAGHRLQDRQQAGAAPPAPAAVRGPAETGNTSHLTWVLTLMCILILLIFALFEATYYTRVFKQTVYIFKTV